MKPWAIEFTKKILATMRYCYTPLPVEVNEEEWRGDAESGGIRDYMISLAYDLQKKAYRDGYIKGAQESFTASTCTWNENEKKWLKDPDMIKIFNVDDASMGAERVWNEKEKE